MAASIGPKIAIDGEAEYRKQINNLIQQSKTLGAEMKLVAASFSKDADAKKKNAAQSEVLARQIDAQKEKIKLLADMLEKSAEKYGENDTRTLKWKQTVMSAETELAKMESGLDDANTALDDTGKAAEKSGDGVKKAGVDWGKFGDTLKSVASVAASTVAGLGAAMVATGAAAGAAAVGLGKSVIAAYADYEQLVGGVDTLFKENSQVLQSYAANAYKTAGLSANEYMDTVTSFSASLISSLGGDTEQAVKYADMAITDMSDNANKMGSDMASIQNAYQGFSKMNYTMLDNLKIGYAGTKSEMERLLADATALSGVKYDISSYADVVSAIHVIQTEMGITGTTALEAEETISGSLSSLQSAFQNLLVGFGNADSDMKQLSANIVDAFSSVVQNITPVIQNIVAALPTAMDSILQAVVSLLPALLTTATELFQQVLTALTSMLPELIPVAIDALSMVGSALLDNLPLLVAAAVQVVSGLGNGLISALPVLIPAAIGALSTLADALVENLPMIISAAIDLVVTLADGITGALPELIPAAIDAIVTIVDALIDNVDMLVDAAIRIIMALADGLIDALPRLVEKAPTIISRLVSAIVENLPKLMQAGAQLVAKLRDGLVSAIPQVVASIPGLISAILGGLAPLPGKMLGVGIDVVKGIANGIKNAAGVAVDAIKGIGSAILGGIKGFFGIKSPSRVMRDTVGVMISRGIAVGIEKGIPEVLRSAQKLNNKLIAEEERLVKELERTDLSDALKESLNGQLETVKTFRKEYQSAMDEIQKSQDSMAEKLRSYGDLFKTVQAETGDYLELGDLQKDIDQITAYGDALEKLKERGVSDSLLDEIASMSVDDALGYTNKLLGKTDEEYAKYMALWDEKQALAADVAKKFYQGEFDTLQAEFVDKIPTELSGIKDEMKNLGVMSGQGVAAGFKSQSDYIKSTFTSVLESAMAAARSAMDIHSPSRKWAKLVGAPMAQGVGVGFVDQMREVAKQINSSIPTPSVANTGFERVGESVVNGVAAAMQGGGSMRVEVPVYLDGREIARATFDPLQQVARQRGVAFG